MPRDKVYITNAVKHFKFELRGKRRIHKTPAQQEAAALPALARKRDRARRSLTALVALGATAARQLIGSPVVGDARARPVAARAATAAGC